MVLNRDKAISALHSHSHSLYTAVKRLFHTFVVCMVIVLSVLLLVLFQQYQEDWLNVQTQQSGESIARQYAQLLSPGHVTTPSEQSISVLQRSVIEPIVTVLVKEPHVLAVAVFDKDGRYIAPLPKAESVIAINRDYDITPLTFVESINNENGDVLGYVNVHIDTSALLKMPLTLRYQLVFIACILVFLTLTVGIYITRGFYKFRPVVIKALEAKRINHNAQ